MGQAALCENELDEFVGIILWDTIICERTGIFDSSLHIGFRLKRKVSSEHNTMIKSKSKAEKSEM